MESPLPGICPVKSAVHNGLPRSPVSAGIDTPWPGTHLPYKMNSVGRLSKAADDGRNGIPLAGDLLALQDEIRRVGFHTHRSNREWLLKAGMESCPTNQQLYAKLSALLYPKRDCLYHISY
jgi:hypothetical protein